MAAAVAAAAVVAAAEGVELIHDQHSIHSGNISK